MMWHAHLRCMASESISSRKMMAPPSNSAALNISLRLRSLSPYLHIRCYFV